MENKMRCIKKTDHLWLRLSLIATGLYVSFSQVAFAKVSLGTAVVHGRQITITQNPVINGTGVVGDSIAIPTLPATFDADSDTLVNWSYQWLYNGQSVIEGTSNSLTTIPPYKPRIGQEGGTIRLGLRAMSDPARSFPAETRISDSAISNAITVQAGTLVFENAFAGFIPFTVNENTNDARTVRITVNTSGRPAIRWTFGGADLAQFTVVPTDNPFEYVINLPAKDFETPRDSDGDNRYDLNISASNPETGASRSIVWRVIIRNVLEGATSARVVDSNGSAITGNPVVGQTLHSAVTLDDGLGEQRNRTDVTYQWKRFDSRTASTPVAIPGATQSTYTLRGEDQGYQFRVEANAK